MKPNERERRTDKACLPAWLPDGKWAVIKIFRLNFELIFARSPAARNLCMFVCKAKGQQKTRARERGQATHLISCAGQRVVKGEGGRG